MKKGKRPTLKQIVLLKSSNLDHEEWLVVKNLPEELHIVHRKTGILRILPNFSRLSK
ncbi:hypothetical protein ABEO79_00180 [Micromonospora provocatoris]